jgi:hypothetical protein
MKSKPMKAELFNLLARIAFFMAVLQLSNDAFDFHESFEGRGPTMYGFFQMLSSALVLFVIYAFIWKRDPGT